MPVVTGIDILGIQSYVFASNRLRDVLAASWMVDHVTSRSADSLLQWGMTGERVLLAAGGNAIVEFDTRQDALTWTGQYTRWLQNEAPGLDVVVAHQPYDGHSLAWGLKALQIEVARAKLERRPSTPQLGLSVTATCSVTGLPATDFDQGEPISRRVWSLRQAVERAKGHWRSFVPENLEHTPGRRADFPDELDHMGRTHGETSLLGIVHVDGNGVGQSIKGWLNRCIENEITDEQVRGHYREWSDKIRELGASVLRALIKRVSACIHEEEDNHGKKGCFLRGTPHELGFRLYGGQRVFLPLQPILLGGDDLTFVCDGRIAIDLAAAALREFEIHVVPHLGEHGGPQRLTACAGVALVKAHAPFHRGYELAEALCRSAKHGRHEANNRCGGETGCWLDWHAGSTRPGEAIADVRQRQYRHDRYVLTMRPYPLMGSASREQSWHWLDHALLGPGGSAETWAQGLRGAGCWAESRNRVKRLGAIVRGGPAAVQRQVSAWQATEK